MAAAVAVCSLTSVARGANEGPVPASPAAYDLTLGALKLTVLRDGGWVALNDGGFVGADPAAAAKLLQAAGGPTDHLLLGVDVLLVRLPGHLVLLDAGLGPKDHGVLPASLAMAGVTPSQITDVLVTHGHLDHVGGLLDAAGRSAFPRATIRMSSREWASMQREAETKALSAAIAPQVRTFEPGQPVLPGITPVALYGHTPGHVGYEIVSRGQSLEDIGDMAHSSILNLARPDWPDGYDVDPTAGTTIRTAELKRLAAARELIYAPHFPFPGVGRIAAAADGYRWRPAAAAKR